jgi:hypothetical protein
MAIQVQGNGGVIADVGGTAFRALNTQIKPIEYGALGHYKATLRMSSTAAQTANSRLLELQNPSASVLIIPTRLTVRAMQTAAGTAQENSLDIYKATSFTVVSSVNAVTGAASKKRTSMGASAAALRYLTLTGVAAGMTGSTATKDTLPIGTIPYNVAAAIQTSGPIANVDVFDDVNGTHPLVLAQNEGMVIENRVLNVTSYGVTWFIDLAWAEVLAY